MGLLLPGAGPQYVQRGAPRGSVLRAKRSAAGEDVCWGGPPAPQVWKGWARRVAAGRVMWPAQPGSARVPVLGGSWPPHGVMLPRAQEGPPCEPTSTSIQHHRGTCLQGARAPACRRNRCRAQVHVTHLITIATTEGAQARGRFCQLAHGVHDPREPLLAGEASRGRGAMSTPTVADGAPSIALIAQPPPAHTQALRRPAGTSRWPGATSLASHGRGRYRQPAERKICT